MAFNVQTFKTRALTAILFVIVMLVGLLWNEWSFLVLFSIIHFGCWWEYLRIIEKIYSLKFNPYLKLGLMVVGYGMMILFCGYVYRLGGYVLKENVFLPISVAGFVILIVGIFQPTRIGFRSFWVAAAGLLYISFSWGLLIYLRSGDVWFPYSISKLAHENQIAPSDTVAASLWLVKNLTVCLTIIFTMWINDTMAYIVGSLFGKTPLTKISPKKTWEGTVGGIILAVILMGLASSTFSSWNFDNDRPYSIPAYFWYGLVAVAAIAGTFGDLLESKLKRLANIKDSGQIMPGHGGFLDRFDSLILAVPFCWLYIFVFQRL